MLSKFISVYLDGKLPKCKFGSARVITGCIIRGTDNAMKYIIRNIKRRYAQMFIRPLHGGYLFICLNFFLNF